MLFIETAGSWRDMGRQLGKTFSAVIERCFEYYCPWLREEQKLYSPAISEVRRLLQKECPDLLEESDGMADGAGMDPELALGYRFFGEMKERVGEGCSVVFLEQTDVGPLLGRNCDLSPVSDPEIQLVRVCRPDGGAPSIQTTFVGMASGLGVTARGLGTAGASAHTQERYGESGLPGQVLNFLLLERCRNVAEARELMTQKLFLGKSGHQMVGDRGGASAILQMAPGRTSVPVSRPPGQDWQACTNFFLTDDVPTSPEPDYLRSAYARYGRLVHRLAGNGLVERSVEGVKQLLTEVAQPGLYDSGCDGLVKTAYSTVLELANGRMHYAPGHSAEVGWLELSI